ncbi:phenylalanine--tRNA ligase subunit beta [Glugoides intestinalis]
MPSLAVDKLALTRLLGKDFTEEEINNITFDFGIELDDTYQENGNTMLKFDIAANRYDLLCIEGLAAALKPYMSLDSYKDITVSCPVLSVMKKKTHERQAIACAVIRGIKFDQDSYDSFISYQEKLHSSIGRNRSLVAIGTHDLAKLGSDIVYKSVNLGEINFTPLKPGKAGVKSIINGAELEDYFSKDKSLSKYFSLLSDRNRCVVFQCGDDIMSVPPIINSDNTKISQDTADIFVEVTGTDFNKVNATLKHIISNFRGKSIESVRIINEEEGTETITPRLDMKEYVIEAKTVSKKLQTPLGDMEIKDLLERMMYKVHVGSDRLVVTIPETRSDILHECDIFEDVAVAYGFNNFKIRTATIFTVGKETAQSRFSDKLRIEMALSGYTEVLTLTLLSKNENIVDLEMAVSLSNPKSREYEVVRTSLLPGILKSISSNLHVKIPIKVFEIADVVLLDRGVEEGARNEKRACAVIAANKSYLEDVQGPLTQLFEKAGIKDYKYELFSDDRYLENQSARVYVNGKIIGSLGVLHPRVCKEFEIPYAASSFEIDVDTLFEAFIKTI